MVYFNLFLHLCKMFVNFSLHDSHVINGIYLGRYFVGSKSFVVACAFCKIFEGVSVSELLRP